MSNQQINCSVTACRYNDHAHHCTRSSITVGKSCATTTHCEDTECDSFEC